MANLSKVVKLTQEQYNTLASGGTVGDYTGLDPNFLYLVENSDEPLVKYTYSDIDDTELPSVDVARFKVGDVIEILDDVDYHMETLVVHEINPNSKVLISYGEHGGKEVYYSYNSSTQTWEFDEDITYQYGYNGALSIQANGATASTFTANQSSSTTLNIKGGGSTSVTKSANNEITVSTTVNNGRLTIQGDGTAASSFTANQSGDTTLNIKGSGGTTVSRSAGNEITVSSTSVGDGTLTIQKNGTTVATFTANQSGNATANITVPTSDSDLTNNRYVRYDTNSQGLTDTQKSNARTNIAAAASNHSHTALSYVASIGGSNTATYPWRRIMRLNATHGYVDTEGTFYLTANYSGGPFYIFRVEQRANADTGDPSNSAIRILSTNSDVSNLKVAQYNYTSNNVKYVLTDIFVKVGAWPRMTLYKFGQEITGSFTFYNSTEATDAASHTEAYKGIDGSSADYASYSCISQNAYTRVVDSTVVITTGYQKALPTTTTAGKVLKSTSTAGTVEWADDSNTNYYHSSGSWSDLTYTATANGGAPALAFTIPTGTTGTTVALGNHNHSGVYQPLDADLTAIAGLTGTGFLKRTAADTWVVQNSPQILDDNTIIFGQSTGQHEDVRLSRRTIGGSSTTGADYNLLKLVGANDGSSVKTGITFWNYIITADTVTDDTNYRYFKLPTKNAGTYTLATTSDIPANTNQTVKTSSVTFGANDAVQITEGSNITITGDATAKTITISGKAGTVTSVATSGTGLSGGTITSTGTITLDSSSAGNAAANKVVLRNAAGSIQSEKIAISSGTTTKATMQYNTTEDCIEFVFA